MASADPKCPNCGGAYDVGDKYCPECGEKLPAQKSAGRLATLLKALADAVADDAEPAAAAAATGALERITRKVPIAKLDEERRLIYGVVYEPGVFDAHDDAMTAVEIEKMAHGFMRKYATLSGDSGLEHEVDVGRDQVVVVESYIAPTAFRLGKQQVQQGSWVMVTKALDEKIWKDVKNGRYTGYSFEGWGRRVPAEAR